MYHGVGSVSDDFVVASRVLIPQVQGRTAFPSESYCTWDCKNRIFNNFEIERENSSRDSWNSPSLHNYGRFLSLGLIQKNGRSKNISATRLSHLEKLFTNHEQSVVQPESCPRLCNHDYRCSPARNDLRACCIRNFVRRRRNAAADLDRFQRHQQREPLIENHSERSCTMGRLHVYRLDRILFPRRFDAVGVRDGFVVCDCDRRCWGRGLPNALTSEPKPTRSPVKASMPGGLCIVVKLISPECEIPTTRQVYSRSEIGRCLGILARCPPPPRFFLFFLIRLPPTTPSPNRQRTNENRRKPQQYHAEPLHRIHRSSLSARCWSGRILPTN